MSKKQTAVEWLIDEQDNLAKDDTIVTNSEYEERLKAIQAQALKMEREQIGNAFLDGYADHFFETKIGKPSGKSPIQYYNEIYGKEDKQ